MTNTSFKADVEATIPNRSIYLLAIAMLVVIAFAALMFKVSKSY